METKVKPRFSEEAKKFIDFVKLVGKKYPVHIHYRTVEKGKLYITVDGTPGAKIDALFQELVLLQILQQGVPSQIRLVHQY